MIKSIDRFLEGLFECEEGRLLGLICFAFTSGYFLGELSQVVIVT